jgi:hypothetical protein
VVVLGVGACSDSESAPESAALRTTAPTQACRALADLAKLDATFRYDDAAQVRADVAESIRLTDRFVAVAPVSIRDAARQKLRQIRRVEQITKKPAYVPSDSDGWMFQTDATLATSKRIGRWARDECPKGLFDDLPQPEPVAVCLNPDASEDEVQALMGRAFVPSPTGRGEDMLDGITEVANIGWGVRITFEPQATDARRNEVLAVLGAPPVVDVLRGEERCR